MVFHSHVAFVQRAFLLFPSSYVVRLFDYLRFLMQQNSALITRLSVPSGSFGLTDDTFPLHQAGLPALRGMVFLRFPALCSFCSHRSVFDNISDDVNDCLRTRALLHGAVADHF